MSALFVASALLTSCGWSQFRSGPARTGANPTETVIDAGNVASLRLAWSGQPTPAPDAPVSEAIVAGGAMYVVAAGTLRAYDADGSACPDGATPRTCDPLWTAAIDPDPDIVSTPAVANGVLYVGTGHGELLAFDATGATNCGGVPKTCAPLWTAETGEPVTSPAVSDGMVWISVRAGDTGGGNVLAFDAAGVEGCDGTPKTCTPLWRGSTGNAAPESPAVANGVVYVTTIGQLFAFDTSATSDCSGTPAVCTPTWTGDVPSSGSSTNPAAVSNDRVFVRSAGFVSAFDAAGAEACSGTPTACQPLWRAPVPGSFAPSLAVANGVVYVGSSDANLYAFDATGASGCSGSPTRCVPLWTGQLAGAASDAPAVANGLVYLEAGGTLYAFDALGSAGCDGSPKRCVPIGGAILACCSDVSPSVANGVVYVGTQALMVGGSVAFHYNGHDGSDGTARAWTVPEGVTSITIDAYGAQGGGQHHASGFPLVGRAFGGHTHATLAVTPGETLWIRVGGRPDLPPAGGFNGGGRGGGGVPGVAGGGGATDVRRGGQELADRVIVAGGGGGATGAILVFVGPGGGLFEGRLFGPGGFGGGTTAGGSCAVGSGSAAPACGGPGTQTAGGGGGVGSGTPPYCNVSGAPGTLGVGGDGGTCSYDDACHLAGFGPLISAGTAVTGGGGGGYFGGGSGGVRSTESSSDCLLIAGGGGGGSGYATPAATNTELEAGIREGDGFLSITWN